MGLETGDGRVPQHFAQFRALVPGAQGVHRNGRFPLDVVLRLNAPK